MSKSKSNEKLAIWIPKDLNSASQTMDIAKTMMRDFGVTQINNDTYNNNFNEYYDQHIRHNETENLTFCSKNRTGINVKYLIDNANKNQSTFKKVHSKAEAKEKRIVAQAINKIVTLKEEVKDLKSEISQINGVKIRIDTVYIHDTIQIKEKKNFWGKTKVDTTNNE